MTVASSLFQYSRKKMDPTKKVEGRQSEIIYFNLGASVVPPHIN
jgi:hypothetical protein